MDKTLVATGAMLQSAGSFHATPTQASFAPFPSRSATAICCCTTAGFLSDDDPDGTAVALRRRAFPAGRRLGDQRRRADLHSLLLRFVGDATCAFNSGRFLADADPRSDAGRRCTQSGRPVADGGADEWIYRKRC